jgi:hypothetical protein
MTSQAVGHLGRGAHGCRAQGFRQLADGHAAQAADGVQGTELVHRHRAHLDAQVLG